MRTKRRKRRKSSSPARCSFRHLFALAAHPTLWNLLLYLGLAMATAGYSLAGAGFPGDKNKKKFSDDFLLFGTVFTDQGFALPGAEISVRRAGEHKARWQGRSDQRGEFAVRVPPGAEYEMRVAAGGFTAETRKVDARQGKREDFVFRLQPAQGGKKQ